MPICACVLTSEHFCCNKDKRERQRDRKLYSLSKRLCEERHVESKEDNVNTLEHVQEFLMELGTQYVGQQQPV